MFKKILLFWLSFFVLWEGYVSAEEIEIANLGNVIGVTKMNNSNTGYYITQNGTDIYVYNQYGEIVSQTSDNTSGMYSFGYGGKIGTPFVDLYITNANYLNGSVAYRYDYVKIVDKKTGQILGNYSNSAIYQIGGPSYNYYLDKDYLTLSISEPTGLIINVKVSLNDITIEDGVATPANLKSMQGTNYECNKSNNESYCFFKLWEKIQYTKDDQTIYDLLISPGLDNWDIGFQDEGFLLSIYGDEGNFTSSYGYQNIIATGTIQNIVPTSFYNGNKYRYVPYPGINNFPVFDFINEGSPIIYGDYINGDSYYVRGGILYSNNQGSQEGELIIDNGSINNNQEGIIKNLGNVVGVTKMNNSNTGYFVTSTNNLFSTYDIEGNIISTSQFGESGFTKFSTPYIDLYIGTRYFDNYPNACINTTLNIVDKKTGVIIGSDRKYVCQRNIVYQSFSYHLDEDYIIISINDIRGVKNIKLSLNNAEYDLNYNETPSSLKTINSYGYECTKKIGILDDTSYCFYKTGEGIKYDTDDSANNVLVNDNNLNQWAIGFLDKYFVLGTYTPSFFGFKSYEYENMTETGVTIDSVPTSFYDGNKYKYVPYSNQNGFPRYDFNAGGLPLIYTDYVTGYSYYTRDGVLYTNKAGSLGGSTGGGDNGNNNGGGFDYTNSQSNNSNTNSWGNVPSKTGIVGESIDYVTTYEQQSNLHSNEAKGDPVNLSKGEFTYDNTLMQYSSKGFPFEFKINYLSQGYYNGPIGNNFDYNYNQFLREGNSGTIYYYNGSLGVFEFAKTADGYEFNKAIKGELTETDGVFTLKLNNTKTLTFAENKRLTSISDNYGNTQNFAYTGSGQLIKITDTNSREYNLSYYDHTRLKDITDFAGNKVEFIYFGSGETDGSEYDLKTIKMTNGAETREISFTYTIADTFENSHNILKLIDSENNTYVENAYDTNDRVTSQMYGSGTIYYTYVLSEDGKRILENHVTDREQNQTTYKYDTNGNVIQKVVGTKTYNYEYNENNYLSKEINPLGNGYTYSYDTNNNLTEKRFKTDVNAVDSENDLVTSFTYDQTTNKPLTIIMPNGLKTVLMYDTNGNLTNKNTYDSENTLLTEESYEYNTAGELVKKIDPKLNETSFEYTNGNLTKIIKGTGTDAITTQYNYDTKGNITSIIDGEGNETLMTYDDFNLLNKITTPESIVSEYTYNNLNKKTNEKIILSDTESVDTAYTYDILDNPTQITTDLSNTKTKTVVTAYDKNSNITETKVGNLATNKFEYDSEGNITKKTTISSTLGSIVTTYEYDDNNRLKKVIAPNNTEIVYSYNLHDQITKITDSNGTYSKLEYNKAGNITKREVYNSTDTLLQRETYSYDSLGREQEIKVHDIQNNRDITTSKEYDKNNNIVKTIDPKGYATNYTYDQFDRLVEVRDTLGNRVQNRYNKNNKVVETKVIPHPNPLLTGEGTGKIITTSYEYDSDNRLTKKTDTNGFFESYTYNKLNQIIEKKDKKQVSTYYTYDYVGNVLTQTTGTKSISYEYNDNSKLTKVIDANNNITTYDYDDLGNLTQITYPDGNHMTYEYDKLGNLTKKTDPNGTIVTNTYDSQNRITSRSIQTGTGVLGVTSENYTYDALGRLLTATDSEGNDLNFTYDSLSRLTSETNGGKTVNYTYDDNGNTTSIDDVNYAYDELNRLKTVVRHSELDSESIANYNYDSLNLLSQTLGNGVQTNYTYDTLNRLESLNNNTYTYDPNSNITSNGSDSYTYDNLNQLTKANYSEKLVNKNSNTYQYDLMGNRKYETQTRINKNGNPVNKVFAYTKNNLNQYQDRLVYTGATTDTEIIPETNTGTILEDLTETGEIEILNTEILPETETNTGETTEEETTTPEEIVDLQGRLLYDKNGNMIGNLLNNKRQYIYSYDYKNRLVKIEKTIYKKVNGTETNEVEQITRIIEYKYDVLGRRIKKINNNLTYTKYYYSNQNLIEEEYYTKADKLKNQKNYVYGSQTDDVLTMENIDYKTRKIQQEYVNNKGVTKIRTIREEYTETSTYYYEKDEKGSITKITDKDGTTIEQYLYDAYGTPYTKTQSGETVIISNLKPSLIGNTRLYTGREYDRGLQLYYNRARYYNPQLGRFLSRDPIDISDDVNLYTYVGNNPVMYVDLMGVSKDAIIKLFNQAKDEIDAFLYFNDNILINNNIELDLNEYYFNMEYKGSFSVFGYNIIGVGKYDLAMGGYQINKRYDTDRDGNVIFDGEELNLGEISNVLAGLNAYRFGFSQSHLEKRAMKTVVAGGGNGVEGELADSILYDYGYKLGKLEDNNGKLTDDEIIEYVKEATIARKDYLNNK